MATPPATLWLRIFLGAYAVVFALWLTSAATPAPYGDLTQMARLSERDFGWTQPQPEVDPAQLRDVPLAQADVLVIGDSFSMSRYWQSALVKRGLRVATLHWDQLDNTLCADLGPWLERAGFRGRQVLIESVERLLDRRTRLSEACQHMGPAVDVAPERVMAISGPAPWFAPNWQADFTTGWVTYRRTRQAEKAAGDLPMEPGTVVRPVPGGCLLFSHRLCDKALFYAEDRQNGPLTEDTARRLVRFNATHKALPITWLVIPNKTTVYLDPHASQPFEAAFQASALGPDLFGFARERYAGVRDFYFPNDTHLSIRGQLMLGEHLLQTVPGLRPAP